MPAPLLCCGDQANDTLSGATIAADDEPPVYAVDVCASTSRTQSGVLRNREWGGRWLNGHPCYMVRPNSALHVSASVNNGALFLRWQFGHPSTSVLIRTTGGHRGSRRGPQKAPSGPSCLLDLILKPSDERTQADILRQPSLFKVDAPTAGPRFLIGKNRTAKAAPKKIALNRLWESPNWALWVRLCRVSGG